MNKNLAIVKFILSSFGLLFKILTHARTIKFEIKLKKYEYDYIIIFQTAKDTDIRLSKLSEYVFTNKNQALEWEISIFVNVNKQYHYF